MGYGFLFFLGISFGEETSTRFLASLCFVALLDIEVDFALDVSAMASFGTEDGIVMKGSVLLFITIDIPKWSE